MNNLVFQLPDVICLDVLSSWIEIWSLLEFDSGCCNPKCRKYLFAEVYHNPLLCLQLNNKLTNKKMITWLCGYQVKPRNLFVHSAVLSGSQQFLKLNISHLEKFQFESYNIESFYGDFIKVLNKCTQLTFLSMTFIHGFTKESWSQMEPFHKLNHFELTRCNLHGLDSLVHSNCKLTHFKIIEDYQNVSESDILQFYTTI